MASGMEEITGQIDKINFKTLVTREGVPFAADLWGVGSFLRDDRYFKEVLWGRLGGALKKNYGVIGFAVNYDMDNVANCAKDIIDQAGRDPKALLELALKGKKLGSDLEEFTFKIKHTDFSGTTDKKLISLFGQFLEKFSVFSPYFIVPLSVERHLQETIREGLKDLVDPSDDINSVLIELTSPPEHDAMYNERLDLLKIAEKYGSGKDVSEDIEKHIDEFGNVCIRWCMGEPWTHDELMEKVEGIKDAKKQISRLAAEDRRVAADFKRFEKEHPDRKELIEFIKVAKWYVWLRTYRTQVLSGSIANIYPLLSEIGRRRGLSLREILCYVPEEILSGKILSRGEIKKRKEAFADLLLFGKRYIFSGKDAKFLIDYWQKKHPVASEIKGTVA
ncbi:MAG: hypothetical protein KGH58_01965, partial [Candidatus Micrarchaeota archaeon]|nr:hypothetical protein [Candidatus Micrarchaeota archaeon]